MKSINSMKSCQETKSFLEGSKFKQLAEKSCELGITDSGALQNLKD